MQRQNLKHNRDAVTNTVSSKIFSRLIPSYQWWRHTHRAETYWLALFEFWCFFFNEFVFSSEIT